MLVGSVTGYLAGRFRRIDALIDPWAVITLNLPVLVVVVLAYIWIGLNDIAAVVAVAIVKAPTVFVTVREGARALDPSLDDVAMVFRLPAWRRLRRIEFPQLLPYLAASARSGLSITWKIVLVVELLGRPNGVGFVLNLYFQNFDVTGILAYGLTFAVIMLLVEATVLQPWDRSSNAWRRQRA
jgi:NitT/TauT family transport system permease protein